MFNLKDIKQFLHKTILKYFNKYIYLNTLILNKNSFNKNFSILNIYIYIYHLANVKIYIIIVSF